jgi:hypothetical protein
MSKDENETVVIDMSAGGRLKLCEQIHKAMIEAGYKEFDYGSLELGFELTPEWPAGKDTELTLAQLVVIATKLNVRVMIHDLDIVPR